MSPPPLRFWRVQFETCTLKCVCLWFGGGWNIGVNSSLDFKTSQNVSTSLWFKWYGIFDNRDRSLSVCCFQPTPGSLFGLWAYVWMKEKKRDTRCIAKRRERVWWFRLTGRHMARLVFLSVFCLKLYASPRQAGVQLIQDHSCGTGGERGRAWEKRRSARDRGKTTGRSSTAANAAFFFHLHNLLSPLAHPLSPSYQLSWHCCSSAVHSFSICSQTHRINVCTNLIFQSKTKSPYAAK